MQKPAIKWIAVLCTVVLALALLSACTGTGGSSQSSSVESGSQSDDESISLPEGIDEDDLAVEPEDRIAVRVGTLKGPTGMGMVGMMKAQEDGTASNDYEFTLAGAPDEIRAKLISGELDIAALPTNMASVVYNKADQSVSILAVNTLGVLYVLEKGEPASSMEDLRGKTIYATGQGAAPEYVLNYLLTANGLVPGEDVMVEYLTEHAELAAQMIAGEVTLAMLPEPFVTTTTNQDEEINVVLNLTEEWDKVSGGASLAMGCIVVRNDFLAENKVAVDRFLSDYEESVHFVNRDIADAAALMGEYEIIAAAVAEKAIPLCNIVYLDGEEMKTSVQGFLQVLFDAEPQSVGGSMPDDAFYYSK